MSTATTLPSTAVPSGLQLRESRHNDIGSVCKDGRSAVCHTGSGKNKQPKMLCLTSTEVKRHLKHGDELGVCLEEETKKKERLPAGEADVVCADGLLPVCHSTGSGKRKRATTLCLTATVVVA